MKSAPSTTPAAVGSSPLRDAIDRAALHVLRHQTPQGAIHRPAAGRAIETALTLYLFADLSGHEEERERLRAFCRRFLDSPADRTALGRLAEIDRDVSRAVVAAVLDRPEKRAWAQRVLLSWPGFGHPSRRRKLILWSVLLAQLDPALRSGEPFPNDCFRSATDQEWARLLMSAVEAIDTVARAGHPGDCAAALEQLAASQSPDGSWKRHGLLTVAALIAFREAGRLDAVFERGIAYLRREMRVDGGVPFVPDLDIWVTGLTGLILNALPEPRFDLAPLARFLVRTQLPSGGWCFTVNVDSPDVDDTGLCLMFLERWNATQHAECIRRARRFVLQFRNDDGGFPTASVRGAGSEAEITARGIMVMAGEEDLYGAEIGTAVRWLERAQRDDGTFGLEWTLCAYYPIAQVLLALASLRPAAASPAMAHRCVGYVLGNQRPDGGWGPVPGAPSECLPTSYALVALAHAPSPPLPAIRRGCDFLLGRQLADGSFTSPPDAVGPRPLVYEMDLYPTIYGLWGLVASLAALNGSGGRSTPSAREIVRRR